jgi:hypothetical protein
MKKPPTKTEREHMGRVKSLGCILCRHPAEVHHMTIGAWALRASHFETMPLCLFHHRTGPKGHAVHNCTPLFEANYKATEQELLDRTRQMLLVRYPQFNPHTGEKQ